MKSRLSCGLAFGFLFACGGTPPAKTSVALKPVHVRTLEERRADVCARSDLAPVGAQILGSETKVDDAAALPVRSVHVRDASNAEVILRDEVTAPIRVGSPLTAHATRETIRRAWQTGKFDDVAIETEPENGGIAVIVRVAAKRTVANVFVSGDAEPDALHVSQGATYDAVALTSAKRAVLDLERTEGHLDATLAVSSAFADAEKKSVDVCVKLVRGPRIAIDEIKIHGSAFDALLAADMAREDKSNIVDHVVDEDLLARDELIMAAELYEHGLLTHELKRTTVRHGGGITIDFAVKDGPTFHYGVLDVKGDLVKSKGDYMKLVTLKQGDVFSRAEVMAVLEKIRALHKSANKEDISVEPETELDVPNQSVAITIMLHDPHAVAAPPSTPTTTTHGFSIVDLARGNGRVAKVGDTVSLHYKGTLTNGTVFDDSHKHGPFNFKIGGGSVIKGFDAGVTGMKIGGKRRITIPPDMAYGSRAMGNIPANSTLVFEIELLSIQ